MKELKRAVLMKVSEKQDVGKVSQGNKKGKSRMDFEEENRVHKGVLMAWRKLKKCQSFSISMQAH